MPVQFLHERPPLPLYVITQATPKKLSNTVRSLQSKIHVMDDGYERDNTIYL